MGNPPSVVSGAAPRRLNHDLFLGTERDALGRHGDLELGQQVDVVFQRPYIDIPGGRHQPPAQALHKGAHTTAGADQQAFADGQAGVAAAAQGQVFAAGDMGGVRGAAGDAGGAVQYQMWLGQFRVVVGVGVAAGTANGTVLRLEGVGDFVLVAAFLGQVVAGFAGESGMVLAGGVEVFGGFRQVGVVLGGAGAQLGGE
ncbi:hypothetical protein D3C78_1321360 [compost metagenome]